MSGSLLRATLSGSAAPVKEPEVSVRGVKIDPQTAERAACDDDITYRIEAIQDVVDLGLDFNNAIVQPTGAYHYHGPSQELISSADTGDDLVHVGFAYDGFLIYQSKSQRHKPSCQLIENDRESANCQYTIPNDGRTVIFDGPTPLGVFVEDWNLPKDQATSTNATGRQSTDNTPTSSRTLTLMPADA